MKKPAANINAVHALVRTFAGVEDFARVNAHYMRRRFIPVLRNERFSRCCLTCLTQTGKLILDSEWHALYDCPSHDAARCRFALATKFSRNSDVESNPADINTIVAFAGKNAGLLGELAKFLLNIRMTRRRDHRRLTSDGPNGRNKVVHRLVWESWRAALSSDH